MIRNIRNKKQGGFTLIELLVVIAIIGLLASVVLLSLNSARAKSRDAKRLADIRQIAAALELYFNDCGSYPVIASGAAVVLNNTRSLSEGTSTTPPCGANTRATGADGGIGTTSSGTVLLGQFPFAPTPSDLTGTCDNNNATGAPTGYVAPTWPASTTWNDYVYYGSANSYQITFCLGAQTGGTPSGKHILSPVGVQ